MLNKIIIMGRLVADPVLKSTQNGIAVCTFTIACERDYKNSYGKTEVDFINCTAWRKRAEHIAKYFSKGRMIALEGRLQIDKYTDRNNNTRYSTNISVNNAYFADSKRTDNSPRPDSANIPAQNSQPVNDQSAYGEYGGYGSFDNGAVHGGYGSYNGYSGDAGEMGEMGYGGYNANSNPAYNENPVGNLSGVGDEEDLPF